MPIIRFDDDDIDTLRQVADWFRKRKPMPTRGRVVEIESYSPDVFVALTPEDGIWPMSGELSTGTGTGTGTVVGEGNSPGYADCDIYKIEYNEQTPNLVDAGFTRRVHNLLFTLIPGNAWVVVVRDKWGDWYVPPLAGLELGECDSGGPGTGTEFLRGKLDGAMSYQGSATMSVWAWNGSAEADTGDNVTVYDWLLSSGQTIASGTQVTAHWDTESGRYYLTGAQCS